MGVVGISLSPWLLLSAPILLLVYYVLPFATTYRHLASIPGPFSAKFSNIWLGLSARKGQKFAAVDWAHRKYGTIVRVGYNHVSIADEAALQIVYAHGNGFLKDTFYEAFVVGVTGMFNTRDRIEHARKRKIMAHAFSPKSVGEFEPYMKSNIERWVAQLDRKASYPTRNGFAEYDAMPWFSYLAFDIIGDLAFGSPFGMVEKGRDEVEAQLTHGGDITITPAVEVLNRRGEISSTLGLLPALRPIAKYLPDPFFTKGVEAVANLNGIAVRAVAHRLDAFNPVDKKAPASASASPRNDILDRLINGKDSNNQPMNRAEITAEALTQLIAGSDTISNTSCAIFYWILHGERTHPGTILTPLHAELDAAIPTSQPAASYSQVKNLPFLKRCIDEAMRLHSTSALGLPRIVVNAAIEYKGFCFPTGTVLSVPSYTIHHQPEIWGADADEFRPGRWENLSARQRKAFNPFSYGPRACVGQNVAVMELQIILATVFRRYEFELYQEVLESHEGFSKKPKECWVGIKRRVV